MASIYSCISQLIHQLTEGHVCQAVISPGSRNAPIIAAMNNLENLECHSIVDERSAGFVALGMAKSSKKPVFLCCTSGTALANYYPAIAEAFYARIPLYVISADRPAKSINNWDGQAINQEGIFNNHVRGFYSTNNLSNNEDSFFALGIKIIKDQKETIDGPIHINIPIEEPFYIFEKEVKLNSILKKVEKNRQVKGLLLSQIVETASLQIHGEKVLILHGYEDQYSINIEAQNAVVLNDIASNQKGNIPHWEGFIAHVMANMSDDEKRELQADTLITTGMSIVSKSLKTFLKNYPPKQHIHVSCFDEIGDPFDTSPLWVDAQWAARNKFKNIELDVKYRNYWNKLALDNWTRFTNNFDISFTEIWVCNWIIKQEENKKIVMHLANSMPIRYAALIGSNNKVIANRGTSGIDGIVSSSVGYARMSDVTNLLITGDLSFFYDSNALWQENLPDNLKIVILNNGGGQIFNQINGPHKMGDAKKYQLTQHKRTAKDLAKSFLVDYQTANSKEGLIKVWEKFIQSSKTSILELFTDTKATKNLYKKL